MGAPLLIAAVAGSTLFSAVGAISQGQAQANADDYKAQIEQRNQQIADQNRRNNLAEGELDAEDQRTRTNQVLGSMSAAFGASGFQSAGTPLDLLESSAASGEVDAERKSYAGRVRAQQDQLQGIAASDQESLDQQDASNSMTAGYLSAGADLFSGAAKGAYLSGPGTALPTMVPA